MRKVLLLAPLLLMGCERVVTEVDFYYTAEVVEIGMCTTAEDDPTCAVIVDGLDGEEVQRFVINTHAAPMIGLRLHLSCTMEKDKTVDCIDSWMVDTFGGFDSNFKEAKEILSITDLKPTYGIR